VMGAVTASISPQSLLTRLLPGVLLMLAFIPEHIRLWQTFPVWYHLTFFLSLVPLTYVGGRYRRGSRAVPSAASFSAKRAPLRMSGMP
jgi:hypothetical protein